jgi:hypothetical protein
MDLEFAEESRQEAARSLLIREDSVEDYLACRKLGLPPDPLTEVLIQRICKLECKVEKMSWEVSRMRNSRNSWRAHSAGLACVFILTCVSYLLVIL